MVYRVTEAFPRALPDAVDGDDRDGEAVVVYRVTEAFPRAYLTPSMVMIGMGKPSWCIG